MERITSYIFFITNTISDELLGNLVDTSVEFDGKQPTIVYLNGAIGEYDEYIASRDYTREAYFVYESGDLFRCVFSNKYVEMPVDRPMFMCDLDAIAYIMFTVGVSSATIGQYYREYTLDGRFYALQDLDEIRDELP